MPGPFTRAQLRSRVWGIVQDPSGLYWPAADVNDYLDEGAQQFAELTRCLRATTTLDVVAGQADYSLTGISPRVLEVLRVALPPNPGNTNEEELTYLSQEDVEREDWNWRQTQGQPYAYMRWGQGFDFLRLYPTPTDNFTAIVDPAAATFDGLYGGLIDVDGLTDAAFDALYGGLIDANQKYGALRVDYVAAPTPMTSDSDTPSIPAQFHEALIWYAVAKCFERDVSASQVQRQAEFLSKFQSEVDRATTLVGSQFQRKPPRTTVLRRF